MLRVLSVGLSLPQSPLTALQPFPVSTWHLPWQSTKICQVCHVSDFALRFPVPPEPDEPSDEDQESKREERLCRVVHHNPWRKNLIRQEILRKTIRPFQPPPKFSSAPERSGTTATAKITEQRIHVHSSHRSQKEDESETASRSFVDELFTGTASPSPDAQQHTEPSQREGRYALLRVLEKTHSVSEAWNAYEALLEYRPRPASFVQDASGRRGPLVIPYEYLHRFARLLSTTHPRTRSLFRRLLSVLTTLRETGGTVFVWEWNALIDCAGKGWRKTTMEDYRAALSIFKDMIISGQDASLPPDPSAETGSNLLDKNRPVAQPDIITFTTLLDIASRSLSEGAINHAIALLNASELQWNHVTYKARLRYFIRHQQLDSVLEILQNAVHRGLDLATLNACVWAYARCGQLCVAMEVYQLLRRNVPAKDRMDFGKPGATPPSEGERQKKNPILNILEFTLPGKMSPDKITYTMLIQAMCYHGDFISAMRIFRDMISTVDPTISASNDPHPVGRPTVPRCYKPSLTIYRAIFLGFARHAHKKRTLAFKLISRRRNTGAVSLPEFAARLIPSDPGTPTPQAETNWTLKNLEVLFRSFLELGWDGSGARNAPADATTAGRPSDRTIYWIMVAYAQTTGRNVAKMYEIWRELDARFGYGVNGVKIWTGRIARFGERLENRYRKAHTVGVDGSKSNGVT